MNNKINQILKGSSSGVGIAKAYAFVIDNSARNIREYDKKSTKKIQLKKYNSAKNRLIKEFEQIKKVLGETDSDYKDIFETNILMLGDPELSSEIIKNIEEGKTSEFSVAVSYDFYISKLLATDNQYLRDRSEDLIHLRSLLIDYILKDSQEYRLEKGGIAVMDLVSTRDIYNFDKQSVRGIVSQRGGLTSHAVILARAFKIPMIVGVKDALKKISGGDQLLLNCSKASVCINPDDSLLEEFQKEKDNVDKRKERLLAEVKNNNQSENEVKLLLNVDFKEEIEEVHNLGAQGVGLLRTESIFGSKDLNDQEYQLRIYKDLAEKTFPKKINIRLFDIGNDKLLGNFSSSEVNPALGQRGIRFLRNNPLVLEIQLRAILKASTLGNIKITLPMVTNIEDLLWFKDFMTKVERELSEENVEYKKCEIGVMLEIPSVSFSLGAFSKEIDFVSIGTNDLAQYFFASDRTQDNVAGYYNYYDPSFLRFLNFSVAECKKYEVPVSVCGEMAADLDFVPLLLAMGVDSLSMSASLLPDVKECVVNLDNRKIAELLANVLLANNSDDVKNYLAQCVIVK